MLCSGSGCGGGTRTSMPKEVIPLPIAPAWSRQNCLEWLYYLCHCCGHHYPVLIIITNKHCLSRAIMCISLWQTPCKSSGINDPMKVKLKHKQTALGTVSLPFQGRRQGVWWHGIEGGQGCNFPAFPAGQGSDSTLGDERRWNWAVSVSSELFGWGVCVSSNEMEGGGRKGWRDGGQE